MNRAKPTDTSNDYLIIIISKWQLNEYYISIKTITNLVLRGLNLKITK